ncbi:hypothetical protein ABMA57_09210 [Saccharospirillum sp. HFRX-1]|uniref:DUF7919 family protein n=1 Tax=unclassified Saccharospirillum TaxID=2633430 RepID=UPI0037164D9F
MHYNDYSLYSHFLSEPVSSAYNIGWLDVENEFKKGAVPVGFVDKLNSIIIGTNSFNAQISRKRSARKCKLCNSDYISIENQEGKEVLGAANLLIPYAQNTYFIAPTMVGHYISYHNYMPPEEFISAVLCVDTSIPYFADQIYLELISGKF